MTNRRWSYPADGARGAGEAFPRGTTGSSCIIRTVGTAVIGGTPIEWGGGANYPVERLS
jgi:hypothetical protein